jgi:hypothetical protein
LIAAATNQTALTIAGTSCTELRHSPFEGYIYAEGWYGDNLPSPFTKAGFPYGVNFVDVNQVVKPKEAPHSGYQLGEFLELHFVAPSQEAKIRYLDSCKTIAISLGLSRYFAIPFEPPEPPANNSVSNFWRPPPRLRAHARLGVASRHTRGCWWQLTSRFRAHARPGVVHRLADFDCSLN